MVKDCFTGQSPGKAISIPAAPHAQGNPAKSKPRLLRGGLGHDWCRSSSGTEDRYFRQYQTIRPYDASGKKFELEFFHPAIFMADDILKPWYSNC